MMIMILQIFVPLTPYHVEFDFKKWNIVIFPEDKDLFSLQYQGCWWPGDNWNQYSSSAGIDIVMLEYSGPEAGYFHPPGGSLLW